MKMVKHELPFNPPPRFYLSLTNWINVISFRFSLVMALNLHSAIVPNLPEINISSRVFLSIDNCDRLFKLRVQLFWLFLAPERNVLALFYFLMKENRSH